MNERSVLTLVLPVPSMLTCTVTAVSFVTLSILALLEAAKVCVKLLILYLKVAKAMIYASTALRNLTMRFAWRLLGSRSGL